MTNEDYKNLYELVRVTASYRGVDPYLAHAIVVVESNFNPSVTRFEEHLLLNKRGQIKASTSFDDPVKWANKNKITISTEKVQQSMSYGLFQVLGMTARWLGYQKNLVELIAPDENVDIGLKYLKYQLKRYSDMNDVISAYNAGSAGKKKNGEYINQDYVNKVTMVYNSIRNKSLDN